MKIKGILIFLIILLLITNVNALSFKEIFDSEDGFFVRLFDNIFKKEIKGRNLMIENSQNSDMDEQWSINIPLNSPSYINNPLVVGDVNNNGKNEIIISSKGDFEDGVPAKVFVYDYQGQILDGWPKEISALAPKNLVSVGDINNDDYLEIAVSEGLLVNETVEENCFAECTNLCGSYFLVGSVEYENCEDRCDTYCSLFLMQQAYENGFTYVWDYQGNLLEGWPININYVDIALDNINEDPYLELIFNTKTYNYYNITNMTNQVVLAGEEFYSYLTNEPSRLYVLNMNANPLEGFPKIINYNNFYANVGKRLSIGDINNDWNKEIVGDTYGSFSHGPIIYQTIYGDFSVNFYNLSRTFNWLNDEYSTFCTIPNIKEDINYTEKQWKEFTSNYLTLNGFIFNKIPVTLADINKDGKLEALSVLFRPSFIGPEGLWVFACNNEGLMFGEFPIFFDNSSLLDPIPGWQYGVGCIFNDASPPSVGDINGDNNLEIIFNLEVLPNMLVIYALNNQGNLLPNFPKSIYGDESSIFDGSQQPLIADVDDDGLSDIIISSSSGKIYGVNYEGDLILELNSLASYGSGYNNQNPIVTDLGGDGEIEIVTTTADGKLISYDLDSNGRIEWPMYHYNKEHTGLFKTDYSKRPINIEEVYN